MTFYQVYSICASFSNPSSLHLRHKSFCNLSPASPTSKLVLQPFRRFTYVKGHSIQPFRCFSYVAGTSRTSPGEPPMAFYQVYSIFALFSNPSSLHLRQNHSVTFPPLHLRQSSFYNPSVASPTSQALHLCHLASCPCVWQAAHLLKTCPATHHSSFSEMAPILCQIF